MADVSGPKLTAQRKELERWAAERRQFYIKALETGGPPYGAQKLSPNEQVQRFLEATSVDYEGLIATLNQKYMGLPDAQNRVNNDLALYVRRMITLMLSRGMTPEQANTEAMGMM